MTKQNTQKTKPIDTENRLVAAGGQVGVRKRWEKCKGGVKVKTSSYKINISWE